MDININIGITKTMSIIVEEKDTASSFGSGLIDVYATPAMVGLMENVAQSSLNHVLPAGYITLGIEINVKHLKATPVGMQVKCESKLVKTDGKKLYFEISASDEKGLIGTATHTRYIVHADDFMKKLTEIN